MARGLKVNAFSATYVQLPGSQRECLNLDGYKGIARPFFPWDTWIVCALSRFVYTSKSVCKRSFGFWEAKVRNCRRGTGKAHTLPLGLEEDVPHTFWQQREGMSRTSAILYQAKSGG